MAAVHAYEHNFVLGKRKGVFQGSSLSAPYPKLIKIADALQNGKLPWHSYDPMII
ncbi:hypothetical protein COCSUDRAFT_33767, partial [Coccomyxa subellipsoidea C-169]